MILAKERKLIKLKDEKLTKKTLTRKRVQRDRGRS